VSPVIKIQEQACPLDRELVHLENQGVRQLTIAVFKIDITQLFKFYYGNINDFLIIFHLLEVKQKQKGTKAGFDTVVIKTFYFA
jgi:hypothetical protein